MTRKNLSSVDFKKLYEEHSLWLDSEGGSGKRLEIRNVILSKDCEIKSKNLSRAIIINVNFLNHDLEGVRFHETDLSRSDLSQTECLSIEALSGSVLLSTSLPEHFSFDPIIKMADDLASKQSSFTRLYILAALAYIFVCFTLSDREILLREFELPNPFFEFKSDVSLLSFILLGIIIIKILDLFLIPLTKDASTAYGKLPKVFPSGMKLSSIVSSWTYRWLMEQKERLSVKTTSRADLDYKNAISYYFAFVFGLRLFCYVVALSMLGYTGLLADYGPYFSDTKENIFTLDIFNITKYFTFYSAFPLMALVMAMALFARQGFYIDRLGNVFLILYAAAIVMGEFLLAGLFASSVVISFLLYKHESESIRTSFKAAFILMAAVFLCSLRYGNLNVDGQKFVEQSLLVEEPSQALNKARGINLEKLMLENLSAKDIFAPYSNFSKALLKNANFQRADLSYSNFEGAYIEGVNFSEANLKGVKGLNQEMLCKTIGYSAAILDFTVDCEGATVNQPIE